MNPDSSETIPKRSIVTPRRLFSALAILLLGSALSSLVTAGPGMQYTVTKVRTLSLKSEPSAIAWSSDGKQIAALSDLFSRVTVWNSETGEAIREIEIAHSMPASNSLSFTPDGQYILAAADINDVVNKHASAVFWDLKTGAPSLQVAAPFQGDDPRVNIAKVITLSHDGIDLALRSTDAPGKQIALYSDKNWNAPVLLSLEDDIAKCIEFSPDDRELAVGTFRGWVVFFDVRDQKLLRAVHVYEPRGVAVSALTFSPDGRLLATGYNKVFGGTPDEPIQFVETSTGRIVTKLHVTSANILSMSWSNDGNILAIGNDQRHVSLMAVPERGKTTIDLALGGPALSVKFSPVAPIFAAVSNKTLGIYELKRR